MATNTKLHYRGSAVPGAVVSADTTANLPLQNLEIDANFYSLAVAIDTKVNTSDIIPVTNGGTGGTTAATARAGLGLGTASTQATGYFQVAGSYEPAVTIGTGLTRTGVTYSINYGTTGTTACVGNDGRLSDARAASGGTAENVSGIVLYSHGGTGFSTYTKGDLIYASDANALSKLAIGTADGSFLKISGGLPVWGTDNNTTYDHLAVSATGGALIRLHSADANDDVKFVSDGGTTVSFVDADNIKISSTVVNDAPLTVSSTAAATNTAATLALSGAYSSNTSTARSLDFKVGPALTNLATLMTTAGAGFIRRGATADTYSIDTNTYLTSYVNTTYNHLAVTATGGAILRLNGSDSTNDDVKFVSDGGTTVSFVDADNIKISSTVVNDAGLTLQVGTAAATSNTVTVGTGTGFSANVASAKTYDIRVGPALTNLATLMTTAGAGFIRRGATADTYVIDTNTYLTSVIPSNFASQTANTVLAAPNGSAGTPTFRTLAAADIPNLDAAKITSGVIDAARLPSYVDDVLEYANVAAFPGTGEAAKMYVALDTNKVYRWSGSAYIYITSGAVDSVAGKTGVVTLVKGDVGLGNVDNTADSAKSVSYAATAGSAPASDVSAWAKAATKPSYTAGEVGAIS